MRTGLGMLGETSVLLRAVWLGLTLLMPGASAGEPRYPTDAEPKLSAKSDTKSAPDKWEAAIAKFEAADRLAPPPTGGVVFFGSSSMVRWKLAESFPEQGYINRGFGGSQMADAARYVGRAVIPLKPRLVVVYSGDNDLAADRTPEQVRDAAAALAEAIHQALPNTRIVFLGVKASVKRWGLIDKIRTTNRLLAELCASDTRRTYVETAERMLGPDGKPRPELFVADGLHLSPEGYKLWTELLKPHLVSKTPSTEAKP